MADTDRPSIGTGSPSGLRNVDIEGKCSLADQEGSPRGSLGESEVEYVILNLLTGSCGT
jgi:hypothetical protein